jgi:putative hydroxymethylpyrimidine transport system substrate-binding protein
LLAAALLLPALAACGDDDDDDDAGAQPATSVASPSPGAAVTATSGAASPPASPAATEGASPTTGGASGSPTGEITDVSIALDWYPWSNHTGIYMAEANGYFEDEGLNVDIYVPSDPATGLQLVAAGQDDFTISYQADVLIARGAGLPVVSVAALVQHPLNSIMTLESSGITRPSELVGKTVGIAGVPSDEALLGSMLEADGASLDDVELVTVGFDLMPALLGGQVDAVIGAYWVHESILAEQQGQPVNVMRIEEWGVPDYYELLLVTSEEMIAEQPEVVAGFVAALTRGYAAAEASPEAAISELIKANPETDEALETEGIALLKPLWTDNGDVPFGTQTEERWTSYAAWLRDEGILTEDVDATEAFTNEFVEMAGGQ